MVDLEYLPLTVEVNCSSAAAQSADPARTNYACSPTARLESTIIHLLFITAIVMLTAMVFGCYRVIQNRKAKIALVHCAVTAAAAAGSKDRALSCLASAQAVAPAMLRAAAQVHRASAHRSS